MVSPEHWESASRSASRTSSWISYFAARGAYLATKGLRLQVPRPGVGGSAPPTATACARVQGGPGGSTGGCSGCKRGGACPRPLRRCGGSRPILAPVQSGTAFSPTHHFYLLYTTPPTGRQYPCVRYVQGLSFFSTALSCLSGGVSGFFFRSQKNCGGGTGGGGSTRPNMQRGWKDPT